MSGHSNSSEREFAKLLGWWVRKGFSRFFNLVLARVSKEFQVISGAVNFPTYFTACQLGDHAYYTELNFTAFRYEEEEKAPIEQNCRDHFRALVSGDLLRMHSGTESSSGQVPWLQKNETYFLKPGYFSPWHLWHVAFYSVPVTIVPAWQRGVSSERRQPFLCLCITDQFPCALSFGIFSWLLMLECEKKYYRANYNRF